MTDFPFLSSLTPAPIFGALLFGAIIGSFLNTVIHRLPRMALGTAETPYNLAVPRSACPLCHNTLRAWQNIPILSYLLLRGHCGHCDGVISIRYPLVEILTAVAAALMLWRFGIGWTAAAAFMFAAFAITIAGIDVKEMLVPDSLSLPLVVLGLLINFSGAFVALTDAIIGSVLGFGIFWLVAWAFRKYRGVDGLGGGDVKLLAAIGAWLGWQALPFVIFIAALSALLTAGVGQRPWWRSEKLVRLPFAPHLSAAAVVMMVWGENVINTYWRWLGGG